MSKDDLLEKQYSIIKSYADEFFSVFGRSLQSFHNIWIGFDIVKFDDYLKRTYGDYEDGKTSMKDFIRSKFGEDACKLIEKLIMPNFKKNNEVIK